MTLKRVQGSPEVTLKQVRETWAILERVREAWAILERVEGSLAVPSRWCRRKPGGTVTVVQGGGVVYPGSIGRQGYTRWYRAR